MMDYVVGPIGEDKALRAFVLVQSVAPKMTARIWQSITNAVETWQTLTVTDRAGYIRGIAVFTIGRHPILGSLCDIPILVVGSAANEREIASHLFNGLKLEAVAHACTLMRIWNTPPPELTGLHYDIQLQRWDHGLMYPLPIDASRILQ